MRLPLFIAISILSTSLPLSASEVITDVYDNCDSPTISQGELVDCLEGNVQKKSAELRLIYDEIEAKLPELERAALKSKQEHWLDSIAVKCAMEDKQEGMACAFDMVLLRTEELKNLPAKPDANSVEPKVTAKPEHKELFDKAVKAAWTDLVGVNVIGFRPNAENCKQAMKGYFSDSINQPTLESLTGECAKLIDSRESELKKALSQPDAKPESCRQLNVLLGEEWLKAEISMKASAFGSPASTPVQAIGLLNKSNDGVLYIQGSEGYSVAETSEKTVFIKKDDIKINGAVRAYGINTASRSVKLISGEATDIPVLAVTCIEATH